MKIVSRGINSTNPSIVRKYKDLVYDEMEKSYIKRKFSTLSNKVMKNEVNEDDYELINEIDEYFTECRIQAEQKVRRNTTRDKPWSPKIHQSYVITQILKSVHQQKVRGKDRETRIQSL